MARIAGVDLPVQKRIWVGLTSIYGIGQPRAKSLCAKANVDHTKKIKDLTEEEINALRQAIEVEGRVEGDLRKEIQMKFSATAGCAIVGTCRFAASAPTPTPGRARDRARERSPRRRSRPASKRRNRIVGNEVEF